MLFPRLMTLHGLPAPVPELKFHPTRKWRFDYAWPAHRLALEVDGGIWTQGRHTRGAGWLADSEKLNAAASMGWRMLRVTPAQLCAVETVEMIRSAMEIQTTPITE